MYLPVLAMYHCVDLSVVVRAVLRRHAGSKMLPNGLPLPGFDALLQVWSKN